MFSLMRQNLWIKLFQRFVSLEAPLKFKISGCPWIQTSPRTSRKRRRDSYLRWIYKFYKFLHFLSKWDGPKTSFSLTPSYVCSTPAWENLRNEIHNFNCEQSFWVLREGSIIPKFGFIMGSFLSGAWTAKHTWRPHTQSGQGIIVHSFAISTSILTR